MNQQLRNFDVDAFFTNGARMVWKIQARSTAQANARAWEILSRLLEDGTVEVVVGTDPQVDHLTVVARRAGA